MASAMIHIAVANEINKVLKMDQRKLLIGSIAPDMGKLIGRGKLITHFLGEDGPDDIPNMDEIFKEYDAILPTPYQVQGNVKAHYFTYHNVVDLDIMLEVINELYPQYKDDADAVMKGNTFYPCNMLIMKKQDFKKYCEFVFNVIDGYLDKLNVEYLEDIEKRVKNDWSNYHKPFHPNNTVWYQMRIGGFLAERLLNIFAKYHFKNVMHVPIVITEEKY
jgi:hypothetical protein